MYELQKNSAYYAVSFLIRHWISKSGPSQFLIRGRGTEYLYSEKLIIFTLFNIRHCLRTSDAPWTKWNC